MDRQRVGASRSSVGQVVENVVSSGTTMGATDLTRVSDVLVTTIDAAASGEMGGLTKEVADVAKAPHHFGTDGSFFGGSSPEGAAHRCSTTTAGH